MPKARNDGQRHTIPTPLPVSEIGDLHKLVRGPLDFDRLGAESQGILSGGRALAGRFLKAIANHPNTELNLNTHARRTGRRGRSGGRRARRACRRAGRVPRPQGVVLAAGGFEGNDELRRKYGVQGVARDTMGPWGNLGRAHKAGIAVGADTDLMDQAWWSPGLTHPDGRSAFARASPAASSSTGKA